MTRTIRAASLTIAAALTGLTGSSLAAAGDGEELHFRNTRWRMTEEQVRAAETGEPVDVSGGTALRQLIYEGRLAGRRCYVVYVFADGLLVRGKYLLAEEHAEAQGYLDDFEQLRRELSRDLGEPRESADWRDNYYRGNPSQWPQAVAVGHLTLTLTWDTEASVVSGTLKGGDNRITTEIEYCYKFKREHLTRH